MLEMARVEYRRNKDVTDLVRRTHAELVVKALPNTSARRSNGSGRRLISGQTQIRYLISTGKTQWEGMERYIDGL
jgi:hypothetical protein